MRARKGDGYVAETPVPLRNPLRVSARLSALLVLSFGGACRRAEPAVAKALDAHPAVAKPAAEAPHAEARPTTEQSLARALAFGELADGAARKQAMAKFLAALTGEERAELLEALWALGEANGARARFAELFTLWCEGDPESAGRWAVTMWDEIPGRDGEKLREEAGFLWAKRDFDAAFAWALTLRDVKSEWSLAAKILKEVALRDPRRALELARGVSAEFFEAAKNRIFAGWVELDPASAFAELGVACKDSSMFAHRLGAWADVDPAAAVRWSLANERGWLGSLGNFVKDRRAFISALFEAKIDWSAAKRGDPMASYLTGWIGEDAPAALGWLDALPESAEKAALIASGAKHVSYDAENKFLPEGVPLIMRMPEGEARDAALRWHLGEWGRSDAGAVLRWLKENEVPASVRDAAVTGAMSGLAKDDPKAALEYLETLTSGELKGRAEKEIAAGWAATDAKAAAEWLNTRQPGWLAESWGNESIDQKYRIASGWLDADPEAVFAWAAAREDKQETDAILANAAGTLAMGALREESGKLERAVGLLLRMPEESISRRDQLSTIFANLLRSGAKEKAEARAKAVLDAQAGLTAQQKRDILAAGERTIQEWKAAGF